jgi:hypothetical protein
VPDGFASEDSAEAVAAAAARASSSLVWVHLVVVAPPLSTDAVAAITELESANVAATQIATLSGDGSPHKAIDGTIGGTTAIELSSTLLTSPSWMAVAVAEAAAMDDVDPPPDPLPGAAAVPAAVDISAAVPAASMSAMPPTFSLSGPSVEDDPTPPALTDVEDALVDFFLLLFDFALLDPWW